MPADSFYEDLAERLASDACCLGEDEAEQLDREASEEEVAAAIEQEQIIEASRSVRRGDFMLFAALRKNGVL